MSEAMPDERLKQRRDDEIETDLTRFLSAAMYRLELNAENPVIVKPGWPSLGELAKDLGWDLERAKTAMLAAEEQGKAARG